MINQLTPELIIGIITAYFALLMGISYFTGKDSNNEDFFVAGRQSPWYLVAFGMVGASLSGVTFISVPGWVEASQFSYMQMVFGYLLGYFVIATVLMPKYYEMKLTSIYTYLEDRLGHISYKTGASFFLLSRTIGAAFRLYLVAAVFHEFVMSTYGIPFWLTVLVTILLIWIYTFKGGIKTIVVTDTLQTFCMLAAVCLTVYAIGEKMDLSFSGIYDTVNSSNYSQTFFFENGWVDKKNFFKQFFGGAAVAIAMTGLDQDMMQKNLSCKSIGDAQKNMFWFSIVLIFANLLFLSLGALLFTYAGEVGIEIPERRDLLYPTIALQYLSPTVGIVFLLGLIAAAYSSADSALTALTTSFCIDFLEIEKKEQTEATKKATRFKVHIGFSVLLFFLILIFWIVNKDSVIAAIFKAATFTYGPLLGLYAFGFYTKRKVIDKFVPIVCLTAVLLTFVIDYFSGFLLFGYQFNVELLILNGLLTFLGLVGISYAIIPEENK